MTIYEQYRKVLEQLRDVSAEPDAEAREILAHVYGLPPGRLIMRFFDEANFFDEVDAICAARNAGRPLAYVLRTRCFFGDEYYVDERVLIPRFDTESVAAAAIREIEQSGAKTAADLCCGSGCIGITLARNTDLECVYLADISEDALLVAQKNAAALDALDRVQFVQGDFLSALPKPVDCIVCNPPYIREDEMMDLEPQVRDYEPRLALAAPEAGLYFYRILAEQARAYLTPGGSLIAETGDGQAPAAAGMLREAGFTDVGIGHDVAGAQRYVLGRKKRHAG